jgi:hypothetical protein
MSKVTQEKLNRYITENPDFYYTIINNKPDFKNYLDDGTYNFAIRPLLLHDDYTDF